MDLEGAQVLAPFAEQYALNFPVLVAGRAACSRGGAPSGCIRALPTTFLLDGRAPGGRRVEGLAARRGRWSKAVETLLRRGGFRGACYRAAADFLPAGVSAGTFRPLMTVRRKLLGIAACVAALLGAVSAADAKGFRRYLRLRQDVETTPERNRTLAAQNDALLREIKALRNDPAGPRARGP